MAQTEQIERNITWILIISIVLYIFFTIYGGLGIYTYSGYYPSGVVHDAWFYLIIISPVFWLLTLTFSALYKARFGKTSWTYNLSVLFFAISMILLLVRGLRGFFP